MTSNFELERAAWRKDAEERYKQIEDLRGDLSVANLTIAAKDKEIADHVRRETGLKRQLKLYKKLAERYEEQFLEDET